MQEEKNINVDSMIPIGQQIKILRIKLNLTQADFSNLLLLSRVSIAKVEQLKELEDLTDEIAFRLYYLTQKIMENPYKEDYVKDSAGKINEQIDELLKQRISFKTTVKNN